MIYKRPIGQRVMTHMAGEARLDDAQRVNMGTCYMCHFLRWAKISKWINKSLTTDRTIDCQTFIDPCDIFQSPLGLSYVTFPMDLGVEPFILLSLL